MRTDLTTLVDPVLLEKTPAPAPLEASAPGATLPADFPREEFNEDQLILLEELAFQYTREFVLRFFRIIASPVNRHGEPVRSSASNIACQAVVLSKLLGLNESFRWSELAGHFGFSQTSVQLARENALRQLDRLATRRTRSRDDWAALARIARKQARAYALKAATVRQPEAGIRH